jgi:hypothetical protein
MGHGLPANEEVGPVMRDARLVGLNDDGTRLVIELADGQRVHLRIDDRLSAAVRGGRSRPGQLQIETESRLRPAEIQARIRSGRTPEQVADEAGISVERVERYAVPVLHEREHMAQAGQAAGVRRDGAVELLGQLVVARLEEHGVSGDAVAWDSWRRDDGTWELTISYPLEGELRTAQWVFDPARTLVTADDDEARWLTGESPAPSPEPEASVHPIRQGRKKKVAEPDPDEVFDQQAEAARRAAVENDRDDARGSEAGLFDEMSINEVEIDDGEELVEVGNDVDDEVESATEPAGRKQRASVPSWDEILFGSRKPD